MSKDVASKTSDVAGDCTTKNTVLAQEIVLEGMKFVAVRMNPTALKHVIDKAVCSTLDELYKLSKPCQGNKEIFQVGSIFASSDTAVDEIIAQAMEKVCTDGNAQGMQEQWEDYFCVSLQ